MRHSPTDAVTVIAAGITVHEALAAAGRLSDKGINIRVLDAYSVKPIDETAIRAAADATDGRVVVAEDHWPEGGLGEAVLTALSAAPGSHQVHHLAVRDMPRSGSPADVLHAAEIDADAIVSAVAAMIEA